MVTYELFDQKAAAPVINANSSNLLSFSDDESALVLDDAIAAAAGSAACDDADRLTAALLHRSSRLGPRNGSLFEFNLTDDFFFEGDYGDEFELQRVINVLHVYVLPIIILIGIVGNTVSFLVYVGTPRLYRQSSSLYLAFLAAVDNVSLIFIFVVWFGWVGVHIFHKNGWCQTIQYCTYVCSFLSAWTVVSFTCERWIVVFHPLQRHRLCTRRRAIIVMTSLTLVSMAFYSFSLFTTSVRYANNSPVCVTSPQHNGLALQVVRSIDTIVIVVFPMFAIFLMNAAIGVKICHYTGRKVERCPVTASTAAVAAALRAAAAATNSADDLYSNCSTLQKYVMRQVVRPPLAAGVKGGCSGGCVQTGNGGTGGGAGGGGGGGGGGSSPGGAGSPPRTNLTTTGMTRPAVSVVPSPAARSWRVLTRRHQTQLRITKALLVVSTVFVVLNLPSYAFRIHAFIIGLRNEQYKFSLQAFIWQELIQFLYYSNFSSRFFLYSACSRNFRYALSRLVCRRFRSR